MRKKIRKDLERYKRIIHGEIRKNLKSLIESDFIIGQKGNKTVKVPLKSIRIPELRYDLKSAGGIGSGPGEIGKAIKPSPNQWGKPGQAPGPHYPEVEIELKELAEILGEELELPRIEPKGVKEFLKGEEEYKDIAVVGPESLLMRKRAYKRGLLRQMLMEIPKKAETKAKKSKTKYKIPPPIIVTPIKEDKRYLYGEPQWTPQASAVIIFMRDASGSMTGEKTEIIRQENYWIDLWIEANYENVDRVYILHDYEASEVDEKDFYQLSTGGGTRISSAYELCNRIIDRRYPPQRWNIYPFHFSDGENWIGDTENVCVPLLRKILPKVNIFCYGQVTLGRRSAGIHLLKLSEHLGEEEKLITSIISSKEEILDSIKEFLGKGK